MHEPLLQIGKDGHWLYSKDSQKPMKAFPKQQSLDTWIFLATTATISNPCYYSNKSRTGKAQPLHLDKEFETEASKQISCNMPLYTASTPSVLLAWKSSTSCYVTKEFSSDLTDSEKWLFSKSFSIAGGASPNQLIGELYYSSCCQLSNCTYPTN